MEPSPSHSLEQPRALWFPVPNKGGLLYDVEEGMAVSYIERDGVYAHPYVCKASLTVYHYGGTHHVVTRSDLWPRDASHLYGWREIASKVIVKYWDKDQNMDLRILVCGYLTMDMPGGGGSGPIYTIDAYVKTFERPGRGIRCIHRGRVDI